MAKYPTMDWVGENTAESFKMFKQQMTLILIDENIVDHAKQAIKIQIAVGMQCSAQVFKRAGCHLKRALLAR